MEQLLFCPNIDKLILSVTEAGYYLNCSAGLIYRLIHQGKLPAFKKGREYQILTEDLLRYIRCKAGKYA